MKERLQKESKKASVLLAAGCLYLAWVFLADHGIPCLFHQITGWECPGCGVTRMLRSAMRLDFAAAFWYHPILFVSAPLLLVCLIGEEIHYIKEGNRRLHPLVQAFLWLEIVLLVGYGIVRNLW